MKCIKNISVDSSSCMNSCNGILITGYSKSFQQFDGRLEDYSRNEIDAYKKFKRGFKFNSDTQGTGC